MSVALDSLRKNNGRSQAKRQHGDRYRQIALVIIKYRLGHLIHILGLQRFMLLRWIPSNPFHKESRSEPIRARLAVEELGTTFVKVGQILSTRTDLLPPEFTYELSKLQNSLKPIPVEVVGQVIQDELGKPASSIFASFDSKPLGVASIGQAHSATLLDGTEVVVKVRKPGVVEQVTEDVEILHQMAVSAMDRWQGPSQYDIAGIVEEIGQTLMAEMDYQHESRNAEYFAKFFQNDSRVHIPRIFREYSTFRVITLERMRGIRISDSDSLNKAGIDRHDLARRSADIWLKMFFEGEYFHADPHPGNLFIEPDGNIGLIDFGMVGVVDDEIREHLSTATRAILERDVDLLIDSLIDLGAVRHDTSREILRSRLKRAMTQHPSICKLDHPSCSNFDDLISIVRDNQVQLPSNAFLLLKTMTMIHGLSKGLDAELDVMELLEPHIKQILTQKYSPTALANRFPAAATEYAIFGLDFPQRLNRLFKSLERGDFQVKADTSQLDLKLDQIVHLGNRLIIALIISALIIGTAMIVIAFKLAQ
jgi:ubiquinone biosynthesis protein